MDKLEYDSTTFAKSLMTINYDHGRPKFKGGVDFIDNFQIISEFANREKNKIYNCHDDQCEKCALAFPEKSNKIYLTDQDISILMCET